MTSTPGVHPGKGCEHPADSAAKMANEDKKWRRKGNFTEHQLRTLIAVYGENNPLLSAKHSNSVTNEKKRAAWQAITDAVNSSSHIRRTVTNCKKKWLEMKSTAVKCGSQRKKPKTGGGPPPEEPWFVDYILDILGDDTSLLSGIEGGEETGIFGSQIINEEDDQPDADSIDKAVFKTEDEEAQEEPAFSVQSPDVHSFEEEIREDGLDSTHTEQEAIHDQHDLTSEDNPDVSITSQSKNRNMAANSTAKKSGNAAMELTTLANSNSKSSNRAEKLNGIVSGPSGSGMSVSQTSSAEARGSGTHCLNNSQSAGESRTLQLGPKRTGQTSVSSTQSKERLTQTASETSSEETSTSRAAGAKSTGSGHLKNRCKRIRPVSNGNDNYDTLVQEEAKRVRKEILKLESENEIMEEKKAQEKLRTELMKIQLKREQLAYDREVQATYKQNLEIRLLEKQLNIESAVEISLPQRPAIHVEFQDELVDNA